MIIEIESAFKLLKEGSVIGVPTDTVYGLAADMDNAEAVEAIFTIKKRPSDKSLIILFSKLSQVETLIKEYPPGFDSLSKKYWPGALTLILPVHLDKISPIIRSGLPTVGFRIPKHPRLIELLDRFGPIVAPSANISGEEPAISAKEVELAFGSDFPVLDGGICEKGVPSTILAFQDQKWTVLREGAIPLQDFHKDNLFFYHH
jgi:L-threonylcarbamoyladenylate synthase